MRDIYPLETISFNELPEGCPIKLLDYGIITEMIQGKVILLRSQNREIKQNELVKKIELRHLKNCLYELDRLGKYDLSNAVINLYKKKYLVGSKKKIKMFLNNNFVPLVYLEEALEKQKRGHIQYEIGDRVKYKRKDNVYLYGIISHIIGSNSNRKYLVDNVIQLSYLNDDGKYEFYPNFSEMAYAYNKWVSGWDLEFVGKENGASIKLREKLEKDKEEKKRKRIEVWSKLESHLLEQHKLILYDVPHMVNNRETIINNSRNRDYPFHPNDNLEGLTDDELFEKGVMILVKTQVIPRCRKAWFYKKVNVLDNSTWENVNDTDNPLHKEYIAIGNRCGYKLHDIKAISTTIKKYNLLI
jgi:hypothetical protein